MDLQKAIRGSDRSVLTDIDVLRSKQNQQVIAYECKGHLGNVRVDEREVEKWIKETIPKTREWFLEQDHFRNVKHRFEFWTTGVLTERTSAFLTRAKSNIRKYEIDWRDGAKVLEYVQTVHAGKLVDVLRENYLNHPLPAIEATNSRKTNREKVSQTIQDSESLSVECADTAAVI